MELKLRARKPKWWEKKWKPKKPILYILEVVRGKWVNTYWWEGNWRFRGRIKFKNSGTVNISRFFMGFEYSWFVVGRSGTTLTIEDAPMTMDNGEIKSLNPNTSEWTCFGMINDVGNFTKNVHSFDLEEKIKKSMGI